MQCGMHVLMRKHIVVAAVGRTHVYMDEKPVDAEMSKPISMLPNLRSHR